MAVLILLGGGLAHAQPGARPAAPAIPEIDAGEAAPLLVLLLGPLRADPEAVRAVTEGARAAVEPATALRVVDPASVGLPPDPLRGCETRELLGCAFRVVDAALGARTGPTPRYLLLLSVLPIASGARASGVFLDLEEARSLALGASDRAQLENGLFRTSLSLTPRELGTVDSAGFAGWLAPVVEAELRSRLRHPSERRPLGSLLLSHLPDGAWLELDDRPITLPPGASARVLNVRAGARRVRVSSLVAHGPAEERTILVESGLEARWLIAGRAASAPTPGAALRTGLLASGAVTLGAGLVLAVVGLADAGGVRAACLKTSATAATDACALGPPRFDRDLDKLPSTSPTQALGTGASPLALGAALGATGLTWAAAVLLEGDSERAPWPEFAGGLALGALVYAGVMALHP